MGGLNRHFKYLFTPLAFPLVALSPALVSFASAHAQTEPAAANETADTDSDGAARPPEPDTRQYEAVAVARRDPEDRFRSARSVSSVSGRHLTEHAPRTVPEAFHDTTGVFVQQTNHGGGSPIVRGMIGPQNLILVDGVRLNNSVYRTGPIQYLNLVDPLSLERMEVMRGPGSVLYGSDAMGGVIQL
jgi:outer membrane receptor for ferrienterochelin and colicin